MPALLYCDGLLCDTWVQAGVCEGGRDARVGPYIGVVVVGGLSSWELDLDTSLRSTRTTLQEIQGGDKREGERDMH